MKYMGSKARHSKEMLPIILKNSNGFTNYVEPFVGGANMIDKVPDTYRRIGADINPYLIAMLQAAATGWMPPIEFSEDEYKSIRGNMDEDKALTGYAAFSLSYGGKWFGGYRRDSVGKRNYPAESYRDAERQFPKLKNVDFVCKSYQDLLIPDNSIIYCDPPYAGTTKYKNSFDSDAFFKWCITQAENGNRIFVSEYAAPAPFRCVWGKQVTSSLTKDTGGKVGIERLFTL